MNSFLVEQISNLRCGEIESEERTSSVTRGFFFLFLFFPNNGRSFGRAPAETSDPRWPIHVILHRNTRGNRDTDRSIRN